MRQEGFTERAQEALALSQEIMRQYQHNQWDVEHILMALLTQEKGLVGDILSDLGVNAEDVKQKVQTSLQSMPSPKLVRSGLSSHRRTALS